MYDVPEWSADKGALMMPGGASLPKIWQRLHDNAKQWVILSDARALQKNLTALDSIDLDLLGRLSGCPADAWKLLCFGAGRTLMGAVGLSWCRDAKLSDVWDMWSSSGIPLLSPPIFRRPARLLNPELVGETVSLRAIVADTQSDVFLACVRAVRADANIQIDIEKAAIPQVPAVLAHFITDSIAKRGGDAPLDQAFLHYWSGRQDMRSAPALVKVEDAH